MNKVVVGALPGVLWMVAVILAVAVITVTVSRGHLFTPRRRRPPVEPVDWSLVRTHLLSFTADRMTPVMLAFYDRAQLPGAIIVFALVLLELVAMYLQARNASESAMGGRLGAAARRDDDDAGIVPDRARSGNEGDMDKQGED